MYTVSISDPMINTRINDTMCTQIACVWTLSNLAVSVKRKNNT